MSNPFKVGDKIVARPHIDGAHAPKGAVFTVRKVHPQHVDFEPDPAFYRKEGPNTWHIEHLRAAIAGRDYPSPGKFKVGDKVTYEDGWTPERIPMNVTRVEGDEVWTDNCNFPDLPNSPEVLVMYKEPPASPLLGMRVVANIGHLADGSGVQKHSAGPIYPCVIVLRDKKLKGTTSFDYGLTSPRNQTPIWFSNLEAAHAVADIVNKDIAP